VRALFIGVCSSGANKKATRSCNETKITAVMQINRNILEILKLCLGNARRCLTKGKENRLVRVKAATALATRRRFRTTSIKSSINLIEDQFNRRTAYEISVWFVVPDPIFVSTRQATKKKIENSVDVDEIVQCRLTSHARFHQHWLTLISVQLTLHTSFSKN